MPSLTKTLSLSLLGIASCAAEPESGSVSICRAEHPQTLQESRDWIVSSNVALQCEADSGECMARGTRCMGNSCEVFAVPCTGAPEDRVCDGEQLLSEEAAKCVAQAQGLELGLHGLHAMIAYDNKRRRVVWKVMNTLWEDTGFGRRWSGDEWSIDAADGTIVDKSSYLGRS